MRFKVWCLLPFALLAVCFGVPKAGAQEMTVVGSPGHAMTFSRTEFSKLPRTMITATEHGRERKFEGVLLRDVLLAAGAPMGDRLKGANMAAFVYLTGRDGYHATLALAEVEPLFQDNRILIADTSNGAELGPDDGPFRLVVPEDHKGARWVRMIEKIEVRIPQP